MCCQVLVGLQWPARMQSWWSGAAPGRSGPPSGRSPTPADEWADAGQEVMPAGSSSSSISEWHDPQARSFSEGVARSESLPDELLWTLLVPQRPCYASAKVQRLEQQAEQQWVHGQATSLTEAAKAASLGAAARGFASAADLAGLELKNVATPEAIAWISSLHCRCR